MHVYALHTRGKYTCFPCLDSQHHYLKRKSILIPRFQSGSGAVNITPLRRDENPVIYVSSRTGKRISKIDATRHSSRHHELKPVRTPTILQWTETTLLSRSPNIIQPCHQRHCVNKMKSRRRRNTRKWSSQGPSQSTLSIFDVRINQSGARLIQRPCRFQDNAFGMFSRSRTGCSPCTCKREHTVLRRTHTRALYF